MSFYRVSVASLLLLALILSCSFLSFVQAEDAADGGAAASAAGGEPTEPQPEKTKPFPYARPKPIEGALNLGDGQSLALPSWFLVIILILFLSGVGYVVYKIFDSQTEKDRKKAEKLKLKEERRAKKGGTGSKKAE